MLLSVGSRNEALCLGSWPQLRSLRKVRDCLVNSMLRSLSMSPRIGNIDQSTVNVDSMLDRAFSMLTCPRCQYPYSVMLEKEKGVSYGSSSACNLEASISTASTPARIDSSDLDIFPSCVWESKFNAVALCRSRRDNLM